MLDLGSRKIHESGVVEYREQSLLDALYAGADLLTGDSIFPESAEIELFNHFSEKFRTGKKLENLPVDHAKNQAEWFMPSEYQSLDLTDFFAKKCKDDIELNRVAEELALFSERKMENLLKFLIFLVDFMREKKIVWGVGRGSSVSSFCLFLIGIHRINPIKYQIPITEFLR